MLQPVFRVLFFTLLFATSTFSAFSQNIEKRGVSIAATGGYVWAHNGKLNNLKAHVYGFNIGYISQTADRKQWHRLFKQPVWGIDYRYINYGSPNILGSVHAVSGYIGFPMFRVGKARAFLKATGGLGYITRPFDVETNLHNWTIGSNINGNMALEGLLHVPLSQKCKLALHYGLVHFSNGNYKKPNLGINTPMVGIGLVNYFNQKKYDNPLPDDLDSTRHNYYIGFAVGTKNADNIYPQQVTVPILQLKYLYSITPKNKLGAGIDYFYDREYFYINNREKPINDAPFADASELGIKITHQLCWNKWSLISDLGFYVFNKNTIKGKLYQRIGVNYNINSNWGAYTALKAHIKSADYFEWGINYRIAKK